MKMNVEVLNFQCGPTAAAGHPPKVVLPHGRPERIIPLLGMIDTAAIQRANELLLAFANDGNDPIVLHLSGPGGCVASGLSLIDVMRHVRAPVFTIGSAVVASMSAIILVCGEPGYRYMLPHARLMLHPTSGQASGRVSEIEALSRFQRQMTQELEHLLLEATQMRPKRLKELIQAESFLTAREAQRLNLIDHVL